MKSFPWPDIFEKAMGSISVFSQNGYLLIKADRERGNALAAQL